MFLYTVLGTIAAVVAGIGLTVGLYCLFCGNLLGTLN